MDINNETHERYNVRKNEVQSNLYVTDTLGTSGTGRLIQNHKKYWLDVV